ncbi:MAG TPA: hypothetical protein VFJ16_28770 [Longimicrobium sp.]|nr:hypothetical protein [Longimicrobium sp.]
MRLRTLAAAVAALLVSSTAAAQHRTASAADAALPREHARTAVRAAAGSERSRGDSGRVEILAANRVSPGRARLLGALVGAGVGVTTFFLTEYRSDYCRDPDMIGCEIAIPVYALGGAAVGALTGQIVALAVNRE